MFFSVCPIACVSRSLWCSSRDRLSSPFLPCFRFAVSMLLFMAYFPQILFRVFFSRSPCCFLCPIFLNFLFACLFCSPCCSFCGRISSTSFSRLVFVMWLLLLSFSRTCSFRDRHVVLLVIASPQLLYDMFCS